uniref:circularly permuted type 2 ATP-grasp protein n=1 Tax=uncultured Xylophilus sp. TaxID=296832 RepID=UPI0025E31D9F
MEQANDFPLPTDAATPSNAQHSAARGHFDELRGRSDAPDSIAGDAGAAGAWRVFFNELGPDGYRDLDRRMANLRRQIRDNGVTYNVYADEGTGPPRPWSVDLFPLIVTADDWARIETGVLQRVRVLDRVMADVYGAQRLLASGLLPPALVHGHPGYLREMHGAQPDGTLLHIAAFDLARGPDGHWWVMSQRTQAPSGLGYLLENRLAISRQFPEAFEAMHVQRLAGTYRALVEGLKRACGGPDARIALLTPGPYNETYFEHAYLARYLGLTLVEGSDLTVREDRLYLKTLQGLQRVHGLLKRVDDEFLDPLELRSDSTLGVPGLLQAVRSGQVLVANAPGSAFLESPALLGFLPALARHLLGEELALPALPTWWCGERTVLERALPQLGASVIQPTYPPSDYHASFEPVLGQRLSMRARDEWIGRIVRQSDDHTLQAQLPLSHMPTWDDAGLAGGGQIVARPVMLRVFTVSDGQGGWRVLPGGMARVAGASADA